MRTPWQGIAWGAITGFFVVAGLGVDNLLANGAFAAWGAYYLGTHPGGDRTQTNPEREPHR